MTQLLRKVVLAACIWLGAFVILGITIVRSTTAYEGLLAGKVVNSKKAVAVASVTPVATPTVASSNYYYPYPGILPDHFLYPVKMARDWMKLTLTGDQLKKAEQAIFYADKRANASKFLIEGNKVSLGVETAVKAEKYLERALIYSLKAKDKGAEVKEFWKRLRDTASEHEKLLLSMRGQIPGPETIEWDKAIAYAKKVKDEISQKMVEEGWSE